MSLTLSGSVAKAQRPSVKPMKATSCWNGENEGPAIMQDWVRSIFEAFRSASYIFSKSSPSGLSGNLMTFSQSAMSSSMKFPGSGSVAPVPESDT